MSIVTYPLNNITYSAEDAEIYNSSRTSGVFADSDNLDYSLTGAMQITVGIGLAWIRNSTFSGKCVAVKNAVALTIDAADATLPRIDRVVLGFNATNNSSSIYIKKGTASSTPIPQARSTTSSLYELVLYDIAVGAGVTVITSAMVTDQRANDSLCGLMKDAITRNAPAAHASSHATGGSDAITPASIGAPNAVDVVLNTAKGAANGVATLTADSKVTPSQASSIPEILTTADTSSITLALANAGKLICFNNTTNITVNIPDDNSVNFPIGTEIEFCRYNTGTVTFASQLGTVICAVNNARSINSRYSTCGLKKLAANTWLLAGDIS